MGRRGTVGKQQYRSKVSATHQHQQSVREPSEDSALRSVIIIPVSMHHSSLSKVFVNSARGY